MWFEVWGLMALIGLEMASTEGFLYEITFKKIVFFITKIVDIRFDFFQK
jgi:hypothetical protein